MPEEEAGFTFVDKRRTQADADTEAAVPTEASAPVDAPTSVEDTAAPESSLYDAMDDDIADDEQQSGAPDIYGLLSYCISLLASEAWPKLGLIAHPQTGEVKADLAQAKVAIDAIGDLAARLESAPVETIPENFRRDLRTLLNDLRLNYVAQRDASGQGAAASS